MAGSQRYLRYILFAFITIVFLVFISSSSNQVPNVNTIHQGAQNLVEKGRESWNKYNGEKPLKHETAAEHYSAHEVQTHAAEPTRSTPELIQPHELSGQIADGHYNPEATQKAEPDHHKAPVDTHNSAPIDTHNSAPINTHNKGEEPIDTHHTSPNPYTKEGLQTQLHTGPAPGARMNATFVTLARNSDVWEIARSIRQVEDRFNRKYNYDWVFLNDGDFDETFKKVTTALTSGKARYGKIAPEHWGFPSFIDQDKAKRVREDMAARKIIYGDSISYRHMCRYESGFFFRHPLMLEYEWYWRVEPSIELYCDIDYDTFKYMADNNKKYSFVISLYEYAETIPTLWESVKKFIKAHPEHIAKDNMLGWLSEDNGETYNNCHFWSNFEIGNLNWLRSDAYIDYFTMLDHDGGFFYERWGDAPVHSIAAALMLNKSEVHFFNDIAYYHVPFTHCPTGEDLRTKLRCHCNPGENFDWNGYSCTAKYYDIMGMKKPEGYEKEQ